MKLLVELQRGAGHHALGAEEREDQVVLAIDQRAHARHALRLEARDQRLEQLAADAALAQPGIDLDGEHPAGRRLAEFPGADLAGDEARQRALVGLGHQEMPTRAPACPASNRAC